MRRPALGLLLSALVLGACGTQGTRVHPASKLDEGFEDRFRGMSMPTQAQFRQYDAYKELPEVTFDRAWDSTLTVMVQAGVLLRASKEGGIVVAARGTELGRLGAPFAILVEAHEPTTLRLRWLDHIYSPTMPGAPPPNPVLGQIDDSEAEKLRFATNLLGFIATQAYADRKWQYFGLDAR